VRARVQVRRASERAIQGDCFTPCGRPAEPARASQRRAELSRGPFFLPLRAFDVSPTARRERFALAVTDFLSLALLSLVRRNLARADRCAGRRERIRPYWLA